MARLFCSTDTCTTQAAQLCNLRRLLATARYERDAAIARLRAELDAARAGAAFYMGLYCDAAAPTLHSPAAPKNRG